MSLAKTIFPHLSSKFGLEEVKQIKTALYYHVYHVLRYTPASRFTRAGMIKRLFKVKKRESLCNHQISTFYNSSIRSVQNYET